jgi:hypothetical protein
MTLSCSLHHITPAATVAARSARLLAVTFASNQPRSRE